jgi:hypothetical protein
VVDFALTLSLKDLVLGPCPSSTMGMLDEDEAPMLQKLQEIRENSIALEKSVSRLHAKVICRSTVAY